MSNDPHAKALNDYFEQSPVTFEHTHYLEMCKDGILRSMGLPPLSFIRFTCVLPEKDFDEELQDREYEELRRMHHLNEAGETMEIMRRLAAPLPLKKK